MTEDLPELALSIRQPWAWAIIYAGKDIENRGWSNSNRTRFWLPQRGRVAVHAAAKILRPDYLNAREFMKRWCGVECPAEFDLLRGGIIGSVEIIDVVEASRSPWFFGPFGLVLKDPLPHSFVPSIGHLGYFAWTAGRSIRK